METSIWSGALESFLDRVAGTESVPASVSVAAVTASLASALLIKVLEITEKKKTSATDRARLAELVEAAGREKDILARAADEDILAFRRYMDYLRTRSIPDETEAHKIIEVPLSAARSAVRSLEICVTAIDLASSSMTADVAGASVLLSGAVRTILISVDSNLRHLEDDEEYRKKTMNERRTLEGRANQLAELMRQRHAQLLKR